MTTHTIRKSTIFISQGVKTEVYGSIDEVPAEQRRQLLECTTGVNSATIVIADRAGREQIVRALKGQPSHVQARMVATRFPWTEAFFRKHNAPVPPAPETWVEWAKRHWVELSVPAGVVVALGWLLSR